MLKQKFKKIKIKIKKMKNIEYYIIYQVLCF